MTRQAEAAQSMAELFLDEALAGDEAAVEAVLARAGGDPRAALRAVLTDLAEAQLALAAAERSGSLGYRRGVQPPRPVREL